MLYKIPDLVFWDNFCSTYNAVGVKVMVEYWKEFKIHATQLIQLSIVGFEFQND